MLAYLKCLSWTSEKQCTHGQSPKAWRQKTALRLQGAQLLPRDAVETASQGTDKALRIIHRALIILLWNQDTFFSQQKNLFSEDLNEGGKSRLELEEHSVPDSSAWNSSCLLPSQGLTQTPHILAVTGKCVHTHTSHCSTSFHLSYTKHSGGQIVCKGCLRIVLLSAITFISTHHIRICPFNQELPQVQLCLG